MISVDEAWAAIGAVAPLHQTETIDLADAVGRVLAAPLIANRTQPPRNVSAMDGYAVRIVDIDNGVTSFSVIGEAQAGGGFRAAVGEAEAVRIFTGAIVPEGADHIIIQEDVARTTERDEGDGGNNDMISLAAAQSSARHIRLAGQDFSKGDELLPQGRLLSPADLALAANGNHAALTVFAQPRIAFIASGDEIVPAGSAATDRQIPDSISAALAAMVRHWGGLCIAQTITPDDKDTFTAEIKALPDCDIIVPIGGASVGDYDYAKDVFYALGFTPGFEKIAVKPGKPCWFAKGVNSKNMNSHVLGLPGNPSSAMVTATLFLRPLIAQLAGFETPQDWSEAILTAPLNANGSRETYLRGKYALTEGRVEVTISARQDSALTSVFADANCLVKRPANAPAQKAGDMVTILPL